MGNQAILVASFGTTRDETRDKTIGALERDIAAKYPSCIVHGAYLSTIVIKRLAARGILMDTPEQALTRLIMDGVREVFIQPTTLLPGEEYERLRERVAAFKWRFDLLRVGEPLLYRAVDLVAVAEAVSEAYPPHDGEALLLMGHGTAHCSNRIYPAMDEVFKSLGRRDVFVATVEGDPDVGEVLGAIRAQGYARAALAPLMLVAGEHAINDMAGDEPESWKSRCIAAGVEPRCILRGLGELPAIRALYLAHLARCIDG